MIFYFSFSLNKYFLLLLSIEPWEFAVKGEKALVDKRGVIEDLKGALEVGSSVFSVKQH